MKKVHRVTFGFIDTVKFFSAEEEALKYAKDVLIGNPPPLPVPLSSLYIDPINLCIKYPAPEFYFDKTLLIIRWRLHFLEDGSSIEYILGYNQQEGNWEVRLAEGTFPTYFAPWIHARTAKIELIESCVESCI